MPSAASGSKCCIMITVPPSRWTVIDQRKGAAWYIGAGLR
jgi:hypothetical protein